MQHFLYAFARIWVLFILCTYGIYIWEINQIKGNDPTRCNKVGKWRRRAKEVYETRWSKIYHLITNVLAPLFILGIGVALILGGNHIEGIIVISYYSVATALDIISRWRINNKMALVGAGYVMPRLFTPMDHAFIIARELGGIALWFIIANAAI